MTFGKELSQELTDIYWQALRDWAIEEFQEAANSCIRHFKHFPKPADLHERYEQMRAAEPKPAPPDLGPPQPKWLRLVNSMFLKYLLKRRIDELFKGNINLFDRRSECLSLVTFFEQLEAEGDEEATEAQMKIRFDRAMARIQDIPSEAAA